MECLLLRCVSWRHAARGPCSHSTSLTSSKFFRSPLQFHCNTPQKVIGSIHKLVPSARLSLLPARAFFQEESSSGALLFLTSFCELKCCKGLQRSFGVLDAEDGSLVSIASLEGFFVDENCGLGGPQDLL